MRRLFFLSILIAISAAFFASTNPDGLDFISEKLGFAAIGRDGTAPMAGYSIKFLPEGGVSTAVAGIAGVLIVFALFWLAAYGLKNTGRNRKLNDKFVGFIIMGLLVAAVEFSGPPAFAARPLFTDDFYTVARGGYELELGYAATENFGSSVSALGLSFKRGFLPNLDLGIEVPCTMSGIAGINDCYLHLKYRFWEASENEGLTARVDYKFDNGNLYEGLGSGDNDFWLMLIGTKMFGQTKTHFNVGYVNVGFNAGRAENDYWAYSAAVEYPAWGEKGDLVAEYVANASLSPYPTFVLLGGRYEIFHSFKLDAGYSFGSNENSIKNALTAGIHWEF
ncbi:MAG: PDGLE domain-containing protein [Candidatus Margulisiibacteriota bacterium]